MVRRPKFWADMVEFVVEKPTAGIQRALDCAPSGVATCKPHSFDAPPGIAFMARKASCEYLKPARLDDQLTVGLEVEKLTRVRVVFRQHVRRGDEELVTGTVEIACVDIGKMAPAPIPEFLHRKLEALK